MGGREPAGQTLEGKGKGEAFIKIDCVVCVLSMSVMLLLLSLLSAQ